MQLVTPGSVSGGARLALVERPALHPGPGEVLIDVTACAVCRTDLQLVEGDLPARRLPVVPGHQVVGTISELGSTAMRSGLGTGDRVGVAWIATTCGRCRFCINEQENLCREATFTGWDHDGGFAQQMVADARFVYTLPDAFDDTSAAPLLCGGTIGYRSLKVAGIDLASCAGTRLGLYGFGASATCVIQMAVAGGCEVYVATRSPSERQRALALGAAWAGDSTDPPPERLDAAITFAPVGDVVVAALRALDRGATVAVNAIHLDRIPTFDYGLLWHERAIRSVANVTRRDVTEFLALAAALPIVTDVEEHPLEGANLALADLAAGRISGAAVLRTGG